MTTTAWSPEIVIREVVGDDGMPLRGTPSTTYRGPSMDIRTVLDADTTEASTIIGLNASHMLDESMSSRQRQLSCPLFDHLPRR